MTKINFTQREISPFLLLNLGVLAFMSAHGDLSKRSKFTSKFNDILPQIEKLADSSDRLLAFLENCMDESNLIPEQELLTSKIHLMMILEIIENISNKDVRRKLTEAATVIAKLKGE